MLGSINRNFMDRLVAVLGPLETNCYLLKMKDNLLIVDPANEGKSIINWIKSNCPNHKVDIYLTHGHGDHIAGLPEVADAFPEAKIYGSSKDNELYLNPSINLSDQFCQPVSLEKYMDRITDVSSLDKLQVGEESFEILQVPGHTPGSTALYNPANKVVFSGDTLFAGSVGNTSLPLGDYKTMMNSIIDRLLKLPDDTIVCPGHEGPTTIGTERAHNAAIVFEKMQREKK